MLLQPGRLFSNFWGDVSETGFYARSDDYVSIVERKTRGTFNVPFVTGVLLIRAEKLDKLGGAYEQPVDPDMSFAGFCRLHVGLRRAAEPRSFQNHFLMVDNEDEYGFLVNSDAFEQLPADSVNRELYDYPNNKQVEHPFVC